MKNNYKPKPHFKEKIESLLENKQDIKKFWEISKKGIQKSIRCNTLKISIENLKEKLESKGWKINQPFKNNPEIMIIEGKYPTNHNKKINTKNLSKKDLLLTKKTAKDSSEVESEATISTSKVDLISLEPGELGRSIEHLLGYYYVQEIASMMPPLALSPKPGEIILDLCSSPGSKTTQIASMMENQGTIIANDNKLGRISILNTNLERCGVSNTIITRNDGVQLCQKLEKINMKFDKILTDVPCSGEGNLRSSPKTLQMWNPKVIKILSKMQKKLASSALNLLKVGGEMIYSTCTHSPEENEEVLQHLKENFNIEIEKINLPIKCRPGLTKWNKPNMKDKSQERINEDKSQGNNILEINNKTDKGGLGGHLTKSKTFDPEIKNACRIWPQDNNTEGFFLAKIRRLG